MEMGSYGQFIGKCTKQIKWFSITFFFHVDRDLTIRDLSSSLIELYNSQIII